MANTQNHNDAQQTTSTTVAQPADVKTAKDGGFPIFGLVIIAIVVIIGLLVFLKKVRSSSSAMGTGKTTQSPLPQFSKDDRQALEIIQALDKVYKKLQ